MITSLGIGAATWRRLLLSIGLLYAGLTARAQGSDTIFQSKILDTIPAFNTDIPPLTQNEKPFTMANPKKKKSKTPRTATLLSLIPGAGQIYNGQWYKAPVVYAGFGTLAYFYVINRKERDVYRQELWIRKKLDTVTLPNPDLTRYSDKNIEVIKDYYQRNIELVFILSGVLYLLNIIDACVFAHLYSYDISDNLSLRVEPYAQPDFSFAAPASFPMSGGLRLCFTLK